MRVVLSLNSPRVIVYIHDVMRPSCDLHTGTVYKETVYSSGGSWIVLRGVRFLAFFSRHTLDAHIVLNSTPLNLSLLP